MHNEEIHNKFIHDKEAEYLSLIKKQNTFTNKDTHMPNAIKVKIETK